MYTSLLRLLKVISIYYFYINFENEMFSRGLGMTHCFVKFFKMQTIAKTLPRL